MPDAPDALTSSAGWDVEANAEFLSQLVEALQRTPAARLSSSTPTLPPPPPPPPEPTALSCTTKPYADLYPTDPEKAIAPFEETALAARKSGLGVNAGHDLDLANLGFFSKRIPFLSEVSIGHALICDAPST